MKRQGSIIVASLAMFMATSAFAQDPSPREGMHGAQTNEKSAELAQFENDVAQLRGSQSAPATPVNQGMRLNVESPARLLAGEGMCGAWTNEKSAELVQFERDVAQLRGPQSAPATPANHGMCLYVGSPAMLLDDRVAAEGITAQQTSFVVWLQNLTSSYLTTRVSGGGTCIRAISIRRKAACRRTRSFPTSPAPAGRSLPTFWTSTRTAIT